MTGERGAALHYCSGLMDSKCDAVKSKLNPRGKVTQASRLFPKSDRQAKINLQARRLCYI
jgi:hypothetical protein